MFKFTIRDLLMATVFVALAAGWYMDRRRLIAENRYLNYEHEELERSFNSVKGHRDELIDLVRQFKRTPAVPAASPK